jgi:UDP-glucuronate decarboxylase
MRTLVTGGAGFLGSHLCERLLGEGDEIICLDNFLTGRKANVAALLGHPRFELVRHDVIEPIRLQVDRIFHLACPASPPHYQNDPIATIKTNVLGTLHMLGVAKRMGARLLLASTSEVYGDPQVHPQQESYWGHVNPIGIRSCYDEGKRIAETLALEYHRQHGVEVRVGRIFNTYGPRMHREDGRVVSNFIVQALRGAPLTLYGDGSQTRSFCYVEDLIEGLVRLMEVEDFVGPVNLGNPEEYSVLELAQRIVAMTGSDSGVELRPLPSDDPTRRRPSIALARQRLGWSPQVPLAEGLARTIAYFRGLGEAPVMAMRAAGRNGDGVSAVAAAE